MNRFNPVAITLLFTVSLTADDLYVPIAQADREGIRAWCTDASVDSTSINSQYESSEPWKYSFYAPEPHAGDTPLLYAIRTAIHIWDQYGAHHNFRDVHTFKVAISRRLEIIRHLLFHAQCDLNLKNARGETAQSLVIAENFYPAIQMFKLMDYYWQFERMRLDRENNNDQQISLYQSKLDSMQLDDATRIQLQKLLESAKSARYSSEGVYREVLKLAFSLPWESSKTEQTTIADVRAALEQDHYGLTKVKEKILDFVAVRMLTAAAGNPKAQGKILCLVGPPGTGKTSIAQSIARGLKRKFVKTSLGGDSDPVRITGKERVYVGAHPGSIITGMQRAEEKNPVFLLDEVDKLGHHSHQGDPAAALLEVLDPEQNKIFSDRYLDIPFDLSEVVFICTANDISTISIPLRDRMEFVEISGYSEDEKVNIAQKYLVPKAVEAAGIDSSHTFSESIIREIVANYTFEAGVRNLARHIATLCAKVARAQLANEPAPVFAPATLFKFLGQPIFVDNSNKQNRVGVANGLAAFRHIRGGVCIFEAVLLPNGKGSIHATNHLGPEMAQASATVAFSYARAHAQELGISSNKFSEFDVVVHAPGSPGDGPSAGITILTTLVSALTNTPVNAGWAMTGELSLSGNVMPVGGIREKLLAAKATGITNMIIPYDNKFDIEEDPQTFAGLRIVPVKTAQEVLDLVLVRS